MFSSMTAVIETWAVFLAVRWVFFQVLNAVFDVLQQKSRHILADAMTDHDALHDGFLTFWRQRIGCNLPAAHAYPVDTSYSE